jgi:hypothetical protein
VSAVATTIEVDRELLEWDKGSDRADELVREFLLAVV